MIRSTQMMAAPTIHANPKSAIVYGASISSHPPMPLRPVMIHPRVSLSMVASLTPPAKAKPEPWKHQEKNSIVMR